MSSGQFKIVEVLSNTRRPYALVSPSGTVVSRHTSLDDAVQLCMSENAAIGVPGMPRVEEDSSNVKPSNNRALNPPPNPLSIQ